MKMKIPSQYYHIFSTSGIASGTRIDRSAWVHTRSNLFGVSLRVPCSLKAKQRGAKWKKKNKSPLGTPLVRKCAARKKAFHKNIPPGTRFDHLSLSNLVLNRPRERTERVWGQSKSFIPNVRRRPRQNASQQAPRRQKTFREMCMGLSAALLFDCESSSA